GFSMIASYLLSSTLVPVLAAWLLRRAHTPGPPRSGTGAAFVGRAASAYARFVAASIRVRWLGLIGYLGACTLALLLAGSLGTQLFPDVDTGEFRLRIRAPAGTRLEKTEELVRGVDAAIREEVGPDRVKITLANIGSPQWTFPVNGIYTFNAGPHE